MIALDMGGTLVKAALVDRHGILSAQRVQPTGAVDGVDTVVLGLASLVAELREVADEREVTVCGVGLATPGVVDAAGGTIVHSANLGWIDVPVAALLAARCGAAVHLSHDVRMAALAEGRVGAATAHRDYVLLTVGTGIGGALVLDGRLRPGAHDRAAEIGHFAVAGLDEECGCGRRGCLELVASCRAMERRYADLTGHHVDAGDIVARAARDGDAAAVWDTAVLALGAAIDSAVMFFDPALVVIGGGLTAVPSDLIPRLNARVGATDRWLPAAEVVIASLGTWAGCAGAGLHTWDMVTGDELSHAPIRVSA